MMWQSEGISRPRCSHVFSSVTDEQPSHHVGAQSTNQSTLPALPSPPTLRRQQGAGVIIFD